jgi:hypothetical protein
MRKHLGDNGVANLVVPAFTVGKALTVTRTLSVLVQPVAVIVPVTV